jgi:hypothetical protein
MKQTTTNKTDAFLGSSPNRREEIFIGALTFGVSILFLFVGLLLVQTTVFSTTNGLWKLFDARDWAAGNGRLVPANFTFTAAAAAIYLVSEFFGILPSRGLAIWNSINISLASGLLSALLLRITKDKLVSIVIGLFFALSGGGLTHSLGSEDIAGAIPAIVVIFILISRGPISRFTNRRLFALSLALAYVHLWEWRAALPIYLALFVLLLTEKPWRDPQKHLRVWLQVICVWILALAATYVLVSLVFRLPGFDLGVFERYPFLQTIGDTLFFGNYPVFLYLLGFAAIIWSGKGVGSIWGGFTEEKLSFEILGLIEVLLGGRNLGSLAISYPLWILTAVVLVYGFAIWGSFVATKRLEFRTFGFFLISYFLGSALFNVYTQPQDPQMQITVLPATICLAAFGVAEVLNRRRSGVSRLKTFSVVGSTSALIGLSIVSFQGDFVSFFKTADTDLSHMKRAESVLDRVESESSILFGNGWEVEVTWISFINGGLNDLSEVEYSSRRVNSFFSIHFMEENLDKTPEVWICSSWEAYKSIPKTSALINVSGDRQDSLRGLETVLGGDVVEDYAKLWGRAYAVKSDGEIEVNETYMKALCES